MVKKGRHVRSVRRPTRLKHRLVNFFRVLSEFLNYHFQIYWVKLKFWLFCPTVAFWRKFLLVHSPISLKDLEEFRRIFLFCIVFESGPFSRLLKMIFAVFAFFSAIFPTTSNVLGRDWQSWNERRTLRFSWKMPKKSYFWCIKLVPALSFCGNLWCFSIQLSFSFFMQFEPPQNVDFWDIVPKYEGVCQKRVF